MIEQEIQRLEYLCNTIQGLLYNIDDTSFSLKSNPAKWSKKEIIGHLIDSAANNHQRFVRGQFESIPLIKYDQNNWNLYNYYNSMNSRQVISFWEIYNRQLLELFRLIPEKKLLKKVDTGDETNYTIEFLIKDYVRHLEHHLRQIVVYS